MSSSEEQEPPKKDLTSIIELSQRGLAEAAQGHGHGDGMAPILEMPEPEKVTADDFGNLDDLSNSAAAHTEATPPHSMESVLPPPESLDAMAISEPLGNLAVDTAADAGEEIATSSEPEAAAGIGELNAVTDYAEQPLQDFAHSAQSQSEVSTTSPEAEVETEAASADAAIDTNASADLMPEALASEQHQTPSINVNEDPPTPSQNETEYESALEAIPIPSPPEKAPLDPNRPVVHAPPVGATNTRKSETSKQSPGSKNDLSALKKLGNKLAIGRPKIEGAPAFSVLAYNQSGHFDAKTLEAIENALTSEDFGVRVEDVKIQLASGKLLIPQISEFAAVALAQKLREVVDTIELDLASEIFKSSVVEISSPDDSVFFDAEEFEPHREEVHDIGAEPRNEDELFSSNLSEIAGYQVTRVLSIVMASEVISAEIAEAPSNKEFEVITENLTRELIRRAFKLGAHGVLGLNFTLRSIESEKKESRAYRLLGTGTAVRVHRR